MIGWRIEVVSSAYIVNQRPREPLVDHPIPPVFSDVRCPFCERLGLESTVYDDGGVSTLMDTGPPFHDEHGVLHDHDGNHCVTSCHCNIGHVFHLHGNRPCPAEGCDYGKKPDRVTVRGYVEYHDRWDEEDIVVWPLANRFGRSVVFNEDAKRFLWKRDPSPSVLAPGELFIMGPPTTIGKLRPR